MVSVCVHCGEQAVLYYVAESVSTKMNTERILVNMATGMLEDMPRKKQPFREFLNWLKEEKGLSGNQLAERSGGAFVRAALTMQANKENPNPGLDIIHAIARIAKIPEQVVVDACLGRPFLTAQELQDASLKEALRKYQMIKPGNRGETLELTIGILVNLIEETLEAQEKEKSKR